MASVPKKWHSDLFRWQYEQVRYTPVRIAQVSSHSYYLTDAQLCWYTLMQLCVDVQYFLTAILPLRGAATHGSVCLRIVCDGYGVLRLTVATVRLQTARFHRLIAGWEQYSQDAVHSCTGPFRHVNNHLTEATGRLHTTLWSLDVPLYDVRSENYFIKVLGLFIVVFALY